MRRLAVALSGLLVATACSSDPILARDLNPTTTTTTTTTTAAPLTTASTTTTTTSAPGPDVSDVLRIAYGELIDAEALFYISYGDSALGVRRIQAGRWNVDGTSDLVISRTPADGIATLTELATKTDAAELQTLRANLGAGFEYRFLADDESWVLAPTSENWSGTRTTTETVAALGEATDAALYLDPFFASIVEIVGDPVTDGEGTTTFALVLDADTVVPFVMPDPDAGNLPAADWDGVSAAMTTGTITLDADGRITGAYVDQTPWWRVGWEFAGVAETFEDAEVGWAIAVQASPERFDITAPCDNPGTGPDETVGADVLICPA